MKLYLTTSYQIFSILGIPSSNLGNSNHLSCCKNWSKFFFWERSIKITVFVFGRITPWNSCSCCINYRAYVPWRAFTESQNGWDWEGSLEVIYSKPPAQATLLRAGCPRPDRFWASPRMETLQPLWDNCSSVWPPSQQKLLHFRLNLMSFSLCPFFLSCHRMPNQKCWFPLWPFPSSTLYTGKVPTDVAKVREPLRNIRSNTELFRSMQIGTYCFTSWGVLWKVIKKRVNEDSAFKWMKERSVWDYKAYSCKWRC